MRHATLRTVALAVAVVAAAALAACGSSDDSSTSDGSSPSPSAATAAPAAPDTAAAADGDAAADQLYPDVVDATARQDGGAWAFDVTISSPYDTPERYADGWRVVGPDGAELGFRLLTHDHAAEQPFTRSLDGVEIPDDVDTVTIEGRDQVNGFGGETFVLTLPR